PVSILMLTAAGTASGGVWDGAAEEPPYDPDYDGPAYPGFDPGDEPLDDEQGGQRESSEDQAVRLLTEAFDAVRIDEQ
ncbi:MAG: hypothetical protein HKP61_10490, partial [Dactylosporangium sp.]|nr:hypothetical protein [Dactylosporangium sp.]NNJ61357.1 hypothetical protein [Dactylosporangium sp.]